MHPFSIPLRVYIEDTDAGGIVYYVNYLKYMERSRTEFLRSLGYDKPAILDGGLLLVVHAAQINYRRPARRMLAGVIQNHPNRAGPDLG